MKRISVDSRLDALKSYIGVASDAELGRLLGASKQLIYSWRKRDAWNADLVLAAFPNLNVVWVKEGVGEMMGTWERYVSQINELRDLLREKDEIIGRQAAHIRRLTERLGNALGEGC